MKKLFLIKVFLVSIFYNFRRKRLEEALRILQKSLWQLLKTVSKFWDFVKLLGLLVNIKSRKVLFCDLKQFGSLIRFVGANISFISETNDFLKNLNKVLTLSWRRPLYIETTPLICGANQWSGFYMIAASIMKGLTQICWSHLQEWYYDIYLIFY